MAIEGGIVLGEGGDVGIREKEAGKGRTRKLWNWLDLLNYANWESQTNVFPCEIDLTSKIKH